MESTPVPPSAGDSSGQPSPAFENGQSSSTPVREKEQPKPLDPESLIHDFKASGDFERFKSIIQSHFMSDEFLGSLRSQVENTIRTRLQNDEMLTYMPPNHVVNDLRQNITRDGVIERFVNEEYIAKVFNEEEMSAKLTETLKAFFTPKLESFTEQINAALNAEKSTLETTLIPAPESSEPQEKKEEGTELKGEPPVTDQPSPMAVDPSPAETETVIPSSAPLSQ